MQPTTKRQDQRLWLLVATLACVTGLISVAAGQSFTSIDFPGSPATNVNGIDSNGAEMVGDHFDVASGNEYGYLLSGGTFSSFAVPNSMLTEGYGINRAGYIVGDYILKNVSGNFNDNNQHGYSLIAGRFTSIDFPGAAVTSARGINESGDIVGFYAQSTGATKHGFVLSNGTFTSFDFPGAVLTEAWKINNLDQIVGRYKDAAGKFHMYLRSSGTFTTIDVPGAYETAGIDVSAGGINDAGDIVGDYCSTASECLKHLSQLGAKSAHGFLLRSGVFTSIDFPGAAGTTAFDISNNDEIIGAYSDSAARVHGYLRTP